MKGAITKKLIVIFLSISLVGTLTSCQQSPVVEDVQIVATEDITEVTPEAVKTGERKVLELEAENWIDYSTLYEVNLRQYTKEGTIAAFEAHLPRLQELGVKILWFMPIHPISEVNRKGRLGSYYAVADYKAVNPEFGTEAEFKDLVAKCHDMGFKVILDWVPNHSGWDNVWITEHPDWYTQVDGEIIYPAGTDWTDVADLNYDNTDMRAAMIDAMVYWVEDFDIDGYRCDVAGSVPTDFWNEASEAIKAVKPVFMLAEDGSNYDLLETAFDANYHWNFLGSMNGVGGGNGSIGNLSSDMVRAVALYPEGTFPLNFVTNHDENSWNGSAFERLGDAKDALTALTFVAPGMPLIYSGQEASLNKRLLFFEKDVIDWSDLSEHYFYEDLVDLKLNNPALYNGSAGGDFTVIKTTDKSVLTFIRNKEDNQVVYMANFSEVAVTFDLKSMDASGSYVDYMTGEVVTLEEGTEFSLEPYAFSLFTNE